MIKKLIILTLIIYIIILTRLIMIKHWPMAEHTLRNWSYEGMLRNFEWYTNFTPFKTISSAILYPATLRVVIYNIIAFIPLGFLLPIVLNHRYQYALTILSGLFLSLSYEFAQVITGLGSGDIDDVILNTWGTIIGYQIFRVANYIYQPMKQVSL